MSRLLILYLLISAIACSPEPTTGPLVLFEEKGLFGYRSEDGSVAIPARFHLANDFDPGGIALVVTDQGWAVIDRQGTILLAPFLYDNGPDPFSEGLARFVADGKMGYYDAFGKVVIPAQFDFAKPFKDGKADVCQGCQKVSDGEHYIMKGGQWWWIDRTGKKMTTEDGAVGHN